MAEARRENDPHGQALADPAFLQAVSAAYGGRLAVIDALWWEAHPNDPAPDGRPAPMERLRALQRRVFAADGDAAGDQAVAEALLALQAEIAAEREAIRAAVDAARAGRTASAQDGTPVGADTETTGAEPGASDETPSPVDADAGTGMPRRGRLLVAAGLAAAVGLGALLGSTVSTAVSSPTAEPPAAMASSDAAPAVDQPALVGRVFERIQTPRDIPLVPMPEIFEPGSFRYLGSAGWTDHDADGVTDSPYYAARGANGTVCLVVVPDGTGYLSTCAIEDAYPGAGLHLSWQSADLHPVVPAGVEGVVLDITVAWLSDATIETRGSGRPVVSP